jgi:hypothetical protein
MNSEWRQTFELSDGRPTGRWQWAIDTRDGEYRFPGYWLQPSAIAVPPDMAPPFESEFNKQ